MTASLRAGATLALRGPVRAAIPRARPRRRDPPILRGVTAFAASKRSLLVILSPRFETRPEKPVSPASWRPSRQAEIEAETGADAGGAAEARGGEGGDAADARRGHEQPHDLAPAGGGAQPGVERPDPLEDRPAGSDQRLEDRAGFGRDREPARDDLLDAPREAADALAEEDARAVLSGPRVSFSSRTRMPTGAARAESRARTT